MSQIYKILVAEDNALMLELLCVELQEYLRDVALTPASDGREAMRFCMAEPYDLIVSDNVMPGMLGVEVLREIRASHGPNQQTPFIFCSGNFTMEELQGVSSCYLLQKPFDMRKLQNLVGHVLQTKLEGSGLPPSSKEAD